MAKNEIGWDGIEEAIKVFGKIPDEISHTGLSTAASKALRPAANKARSKYRSEAKGTQEGYSKTLAVAKMIRVKRKRKKYPAGANVYIDTKLIPVGDRQWPARFYAWLLAFGSKGRKTRSTGANRGRVKGKGDHIVESGAEMEGSLLANYRRMAIPEIEKAIKKAVSKYGKR